MCSELKELLDTAIIRAGLCRQEVLRLEKALKNVCYVDEFIDNIYSDSDEVVSYNIKAYSYVYFLHYLKKDSEKAKLFKAEDMFKNEKLLSSSEKNLIAFAKNCYTNKTEQIMFVSQYL
ncbi:hypothetical protein AVCANL279_07475 [Campylobacter canadensis]|uniref:hypothetical protein n=1 Tax=Campylobacter canadensis TaxID=449520 RepID=UPI0015547048|nr:hypothetical protein [Campylobacter canadensis]MBZ7995145.1 hypothetical protein [Campylobacter canadensis]MBZ7997159.1 hypothetical protein [Campylobacter canadensis]MBZ8000855.1 hypothetical protein [Campylobacter canadensis]MBZ8003821.1 hypothetical protein [Campylobacter canadensis]